MALFEFYGESCPHCIAMKPLVEQLQAEGFAIEALETWNNEENAKKLEEFDQGYCGGVPFFYNTETKKYICGSTDYETLKSWASGEME